MKKAISLLIVFAACVAMARPHGPPPPPPPSNHHHGHHHSTGFAIGAGLLGAGLLANAAYASTHTVAVAPAPVVVAPAPVVVQQPTVVVQQPAPVVVQQPAPVVVSRQVWVEGRYVDTVQPNGVVLRSWQPGHYETVTTAQ